MISQMIKTCRTAVPKKVTKVKFAPPNYYQSVMQYCSPINPMKTQKYLVDLVILNILDIARRRVSARKILDSIDDK